MRDLVFPFVWVTVSLLLVTGFVIWFTGYRRRKRAEEAHFKEQQEKAVKDAIEKQILLPDGKPACVVCKTAQATQTWPVIDTSWLDKVTMLKDLYALTPRYEVRDGDGERYQLLLCPPHKRMAVGKWKEVIASKRTKVQQLLASIESDIAQLQGGAMLAWLQAEHERSMTRLKDFMGTETVPQLPMFGEEEAPISMPTMSTRSVVEETPLPDAEIHPVHQNGDSHKPPESE